MIQHLKIPPLNGGSSIDAHVLEVSKLPSQPARSVEDLFGAHIINDVIWGGIDPCDVSNDTANSSEIMAGSHIT